MKEILRNCYLTIFIFSSLFLSDNDYFHNENRGQLIISMGMPKISFVSQKPESVDVVFNIISDDDELIDGIVMWGDSAESQIFVHDGNIKCKMLSGVYRFKVIAADCETLCREIEVEKKGKNVFFFDMPDLMERRNILLKYYCMETGSEVYPQVSISSGADDECICSCKVSAEPYKLKEGNYKFYASLKDYYPVEVDVSVEGKTVEKSIRMVPVKDEFILFGVKPDKSKSELTSFEKSVASDISCFLKSNQNIKVKFSVYTDDRGDAKSNLSVTQKKADNLKTYICSCGADDKRIAAEGFGETMNIDDNETAKGREANRRVALKIEASPATSYQ